MPVGNVGYAMVLAGTALVATELMRSVPAWLRVRRTRSSDGLSPISMGVLAGTGVGWIAVAVLAESIAAVIATLVWLVFHFLLWREVSKTSAPMTRTIAMTAALSLAGTALVALVGFLLGHAETAIGLTIVAASALYSLPALYRGMRSRSTTGLSVVSLFVNSIEGAIYFIAGIGLGGITETGKVVLAYAFFGGLALVSNVPRLLRVGCRRLAGRDVPEVSRTVEAQTARVDAPGSAHR